ncbi:hypothetical protein [Undibacterium sp. TC9W]|uniref:hypothetical protein n=1 Tax=Undibacterium sp. TC9W TaxID=3413053 RepID=UPI003BF156C7
MKIKTTLALLLPALSLVACANYTPRLKPDEKLTETDSFIYGSFQIKTEKMLISADGYISMGLNLKCQDGSKYLLRFYLENPVHVIKIKPSTCDIDEIVYTDADGNVRDVRSFRNPIRNLVFKPGKAYYVGDFFATAQVDIGRKTNTTQWSMSNPVDRFAYTTELVHKLYPNTVGIPNVNMGLAK